MPQNVNIPHSVLQNFVDAISAQSEQGRAMLMQLKVYNEKVDSIFDTFESHKMAVDSVIQFSEPFFDSLDKLKDAFNDYL